MVSVDSRGKSDGYHHGDLRQALLAAAIEDIAANGTEKLSLRALARSAGVSSSAPYKHFRDKNDLLASLALEGMRELRESLIQANRGGSAYKRLLSMGEGYIEYALANPVKYQLIYSDVIGDFALYQGLGEAADGAFQPVLDQLAEQGLDASARERGGVIWAGFHGLASLLVSAAGKQFDENSPSQYALAWMASSPRSALSTLLRGVLAR